MSPPHMGSYGRPNPSPLYIMGPMEDQTRLALTQTPISGTVGSETC